MPLTYLGANRAQRSARAARLRALFPDGYSERIVRCHHCGRKGSIRRTDRWTTQVKHRCPGPWTLAGFTEIAAPYNSHLTHR